VFLVLLDRILLGVPELIWTILGTIWVFAKQLSCDESLITLHVVQGLVIFNWILIFVFIVGTMLVFDPLGHHHTPGLSGPATQGAEGSSNRSAGLEVAFEQRSRLWEWRCKFLCCSCCSSKFYLISPGKRNFPISNWISISLLLNF